MADYPDLPIEPDETLNLEKTLELRTVKFGGYSQVGPASINYKPEKWSLGYTKRRYKLIKALVEFLEERGGWQVFGWTTPNGKRRLFRCESWPLGYPHGYDKTQPHDEAIVELSITITEEFR